MHKGSVSINTDGETKKTYGILMEKFFGKKKSTQNLAGETS
jgi:hypothetical protein